jgi:hypothetical protein
MQAPLPPFLQFTPTAQAVNPPNQFIGLRAIDLQFVNQDIRQRMFAGLSVWHKFKLTALPFPARFRFWPSLTRFNYMPTVAYSASDMQAITLASIYRSDNKSRK